MDQAPAPARRPSKGRSPDPVDWVEHWWTKQGMGDTDRFLAVTSIVRIHELMTDAMASVLKEYDLKVNSYFLLLSVHLSDNGALLLSHIASRIMVHPTTVTLMTDRLENQGLLVREPHPTDRRATYAKITPAGKALVTSATDALDEITFGLPGLTKADAKQLVNLLRPVRARLGDLAEDHS
ncbi:MarR family winged helix-turn-helix transcriptional regulator [Nocardioides sp. LS1]|uniref:MarR family winged helix-turn-helix transcriptional regulator n=1 Tax=Nocardioides sp. LS1 TaxID=1027620 RepID=UPI00163AE7D5|nr:MarR family transcriptional regulator [Nocardioides sp. LS1]